jgi:hypothetical protein
LDVTRPCTGHENTFDGCVAFAVGVEPEDADDFAVCAGLDVLATGAVFGTGAGAAFGVVFGEVFAGAVFAVADFDDFAAVLVSRGAGRALETDLGVITLTGSCRSAPGTKIFDPVTMRYGGRSPLTRASSR